jgi:hypothetical protein
VIEVYIYSPLAISKQVSQADISATPLPDVGVEVGDLELSTASGEGFGTELEGC